MNPYGGVQGYYPDANSQGEEITYITTDPNQRINTLTGKEDEPTTGSLEENFPEETGTEIKLDPDKGYGIQDTIDAFPDPDKQDLEKIAKSAIGRCPKGHKWDKVRQQCYRDKYISGEGLANLAIAGLSGLNMLADRTGKTANMERQRAADQSLADNIMPKKNYRGVDFYGYEDVNTFTPNPRYTTPNRSVYQPPNESENTFAKGGDVRYLTADQINQILRDGGEIEFIN